MIKNKILKLQKDKIKQIKMMRMKDIIQIRKTKDRGNKKKIQINKDKNRNKIELVNKVG